MWIARDSAEPVSLDAFLKFELEFTAQCMYQGMELLQQYLSVVPIFSYDANDK